jgi:Chaperone of endosialidase
MKKILFFTQLCIFANGIIAQNVGVGTNTPTDKLSIVNTLPGYGVTHTYGPVTIGTYVSNLNAQFGTRTNHPLQFFTNNGNAQLTLLQNGNFGINTSLPTQKLNVVGNILTEGASAGFKFNDQSDNANGYEWFTTGGTAYLFRSHFPIGNPITVLSNDKIGFNKVNPQTNLHIDPAGPGSILIGTNKSTGGYTNLEMGITAQNNGQSYIQSTKASGSTWGTLQLNPSGGAVTVAGYLGIGTNTPFSPLDIQSPGGGLPSLRILTTGHIWDFAIGDGDFNFYHNNSLSSWIDYTDGSYNSTSDERLKKNIEEISTVLDKVLQLKAKKYQFIDAGETTKKSTGFISQEVKELFPELVNGFRKNAKDTTLYYGINYAGFSVIAIKAIQEQQEQIQAVNEKNNKMMELMVKMQQEIEGLKQKIK